MADSLASDPPQSPHDDEIQEIEAAKSGLNGEETEEIEVPATKIDSTDLSSPQHQSVLFNSLEELFKLTASGYAKTEGSDEVLEKVFDMLVDMRRTLVDLAKPDQIKCAEEIGDMPKFMSVLVPFMAQVYKGEHKQTS